MSISPSFCGVVLAAGESSRMGQEKALLNYRGVSLLAGAIESLRPHTEMVIVVAGRNADAISPVVYAAGSFLVINPEPERGQFSSLQVGLQEILNRGRDAAIVLLVDRPPPDRETVRQLREAYLQRTTEGIWVVVPEYAGRHGHPIVVGREMIEAFLRAPATASARDVKNSLPGRVAYVPVDDPLVAVNINTPEDFARLNAS
ncbi:MAG: nucleotidyltransferase family protein [Acidobacteria bacterium]|nr:nucleotidyltransferase family protein [Acidobacteriota bacterium]